MIKCIRCNDTKKYLGTGYIVIDCDACVHEEAEKALYEMKLDTKDVAIDKRSRSYKKAIEDIMIAANVSKTDAEAMFAKEINR